MSPTESLAAAVAATPELYVSVPAQTLAAVCEPHPGDSLAAGLLKVARDGMTGARNPVVSIPVEQAKKLLALHAVPPAPPVASPGRSEVET